MQATQEQIDRLKARLDRAPDARKMIQEKYKGKTQESRLAKHDRSMKLVAARVAKLEAEAQPAESEA